MYGFSYIEGLSKGINLQKILIRVLSNLLGFEFPTLKKYLMNYEMFIVADGKLL